MFLRALVLGPLATNCYLVGCEQTGEAAVIDPGAEPQRILASLKQAGLQLRYIINTHGHGDHIGANARVKEATGADILIHEKDAPLLGDAQRNLLAFTGQSGGSPAADRVLREGDNITIGNSVRLQVIHTPGHTPGGISLLGEGMVFTGDTLFAGSIGRTDFPGGSFEELLASVREKLFVLHPGLAVYPGHGPASTIGAEKENNPFF